jgi:hypothetical protein
MHKAIARTTLAALLILPVYALAADAESILKTMRDKQNERMASVQNYTIDQSMAGTRALLYYERIADAPAGYTLFRLVPVEEIVREEYEAQGNTPLTSDDLKLYANGIEMIGDLIAREAEGAVNAAGGVAIGGNPRDMTSAIAGFIREGAATMDEDGEQGGGVQDALEEAWQMDAFGRMAHSVGTETVNGREAFLLRVDDVNITQTDGDQQFTLNTLSLWVDTSEYVALRLKVEGIAKSDGDTRPMTIESNDTNFRNVAGSSMYESMTQELRIAGVMTPEQQAEMKQSAEQLVQLQEQIDAMPPAQQAMMRKVMGSRLGTLESIISGEGIVVTVEVHAIRVNTDGLPNSVEMGKAMFSIPE